MPNTQRYRFNEAGAAYMEVGGFGIDPTKSFSGRAWFHGRNGSKVHTVKVRRDGVEVASVNIGADGWYSAFIPMGTGTVTLSSEIPNNAGTTEAWSRLAYIEVYSYDEATINDPAILAFYRGEESDAGGFTPQDSSPNARHALDIHEWRDPGAYPESTQSFRFTGSFPDDGFAVPFVGLATRPSFAVEVWFKSGVGNSASAIFAEGTAGSTAGSLNAILFSSTVSWFYRVNTVTTYNMAASANLSDNKWHQAVINKVSASDRRLYIDGVRVARQTTTAPDPAAVSTAAIGYIDRATSAPNRFVGNIDAVSLFNRFMTDAEVAERYALALDGVDAPPPTSAPYIHHEGPLGGIVSAPSVGGIVSAPVLGGNVYAPSRGGILIRQ